MNKKRREKIKNIIYTTNVSTVDFKSLKVSIENILDEEQDNFDNMPENLQYSINGQRSEDAINCLEDAIEEIDDYYYLTLEERKEPDTIEDVLDNIIDCLKETIM